MTDSQLANDRTFLAWLRTGIALFVLGFVVAKVSLLVTPGTGGASDQTLYTSIGVLVLLCGAALVVVGYAQHKNLANVLYDDPTARPQWPRTITAGAVIGSFVLSGLLIVTT